MTRKLLGLTATVLSLAMSTFVPAQAAHRAPLAVGPTEFAIKAAQSDEFERLEGQIAEKSGQNSELWPFAAQTVHNHSVSTEHLQNGMRQAGIPPPPAPSLDSEQTLMLSDLESKMGPGFDRLYADQQVIAHRHAEALLQEHAQDGPPGPLCDAASHAQPMVEHHFGTAMDLALEIPNA